MSYILLHTAVFAVILTLLFAAGVIWDALLFRTPASLADRLVPFLTTAFGTWIVIAFGLCTIHGLSRPVFGGLAIAVVLAAIVAVRRRSTLVRSSPEPDRWALLVIVPTGVILLALFALALTPIPAWDADHYHLTIPRLYVEAGGFRRIPFSLQSNWPLNGELLYGLVLLFSDHVSAALVHYAFGVAVCLALWAGAVQSGITGARWAAAIAPALFLSNPIVEYEAYVAYIDLAVTLFFLASFLALWKVFEDPARTRTWLFVAGIGAGLLAGTKVNGVISVAVLALFAGYRFLRSPQRPPVRDGLTFAVLPAFLLAVVWPIKSWVLTGNPVYPFLYSRFGGGQWSEALTHQFGEAMWSLGMGRSFTDYLLLPVRVILFGDNDFTHFFGKLSPAWIVLIPFAVIFGWRNRLARAALAVAGLHFISWAAASQQMRFLLPAVALLSLGTAVALGEFVSRFFPARKLAWPVVGLAASGLLVASSVPMLTSSAEWTGIYFRSGGKLPGAAVKPVYTFLDRKLPPDAKVLLINTSLAYFVHRAFIADSVFQASQIADGLKNATTPEEIHRHLAAAGVTHILAMEHSEGATYPPALLATIAEKKGLRVLFHDPKSSSNLFEVCADMACQ